MRLTRGAWIALVWTALRWGPLPTSMAQSHGKVRGVADVDQERYRLPTGETEWTCLTSSQRIPITAINDDYCDCDDGTDEPGTSACATMATNSSSQPSTFYCANEGHLPARILSSRVNDGICDPECCDGTDEYDGTVHCPNTCDKVGRAYRKAKTERENLQRAGSKIRQRYIEDRQRQVESLRNELVKLEVEVEVAQTKERRAHEALQQAERMDQHVLEQKRASPLYQTLQSHQGALRSLLTRQATLQTELERLTALLDDLAKGYNPNYQDMAVKGAVMAYRTWRRGEEEGDAQETEEEGAEGDKAATANQIPIDEEPATHLDTLRADDPTYPKADLQRMVDRDPLTLMDDAAFGNLAGRHSDDAGILFRIHEYLPDAIVPYFEAAVDTVLDLLLRANVIAEFKRSKARRGSDAHGGAVETESVVAARTAHREAETALRDAQRKLKDKQTDVQPNPEKWGQEGEFKALDGTCVERNMGEYTYEFCFFKSATQKPNRGHGNVSLGRFAKFAPKDPTITPNDPRFYLRQVYDHGQRCWNGPDRSLLVDFVCAPENALLDVFEGEKCIYEAKVSTPAVCLPLDRSAETEAHVPIKDEL